MSESSITLDQLARHASVTPRTLLRWFSAGLIRGKNLGRGPGRGVVLSREHAAEALALLALRNAGISSKRLRQVACCLRGRNAASATYLSLGPMGRTSLLGTTPEVTTASPRDGRRPYLGVLLDLRPLRAELRHLTTMLRREGTARRTSAASVKVTRTRT